MQTEGSERFVDDRRAVGIDVYAVELPPGLRQQNAAVSIVATGMYLAEGMGQALSHRADLDDYLSVHLAEQIDGFSQIRGGLLSELLELCVGHMSHECIVKTSTGLSRIRLIRDSISETA